jgi:hypothetical protein
MFIGQTLTDSMHPYHNPGAFIYRNDQDDPIIHMEVRGKPEWLEES